MSLPEAKWLQITDSILAINEIIDEVDMRQCFLERLRQMVPYQMADFYIVDQSHSNFLLHPVGVDYPIENQKAYDNIFHELDYSKSLLFLSRSLVFRDTDLMEDAAREKTEFYTDYLAPAGLHYVASMILCRLGESLGMVNLHRTKEQGDFQEAELFILRLLEPHLSNRLWHLKNYVAASDMHPVHGKNRLMSEYKLTQREVDVVNCLLTGKSNGESAETLFISEDTVKKHIGSIYQKTGVRNRAQLIALLLRH